MSRRRAPTLATLADNAAAGRRVVASSGQLDGPFLAALAKVNLSPIGYTDAVPPSTWGPGVTLGDQVSTWGDGVSTANAESQMPEPSDNAKISDTKQGAK